MLLFSKKIDKSQMSQPPKCAQVAVVSNLLFTGCIDGVDIELVSKELNHLAAILHVYAGGLNFMK